MFLQSLASPHFSCLHCSPCAMISCLHYSKTLLTDLHFFTPAPQSMLHQIPRELFSTWNRPSYCSYPSITTKKFLVAFNWTYNNQTLRALACLAFEYFSNGHVILLLSALLCSFCCTGALRFFYSTLHSAFLSLKTWLKCHLYKKAFHELLIKNISPSLLFFYFHVCFTHNTYCCLVGLFDHLPPLSEHFLMYLQDSPHCLKNGRNSIIFQ